MYLQSQLFSTQAFDQITSKVLTSLIAGLVLFLLGLLFKSIRHAIFYKRHEFELEYDSDFRDCEYDIQWEALRVTIEVGAAHNDYLSNITIKRNSQNPGETFPVLKVSEQFHQISGYPLYVKLNSIVRM